jgi:hypothetical protein
MSNEVKVAWAVVTLCTGETHGPTKTPRTVTYHKGDLIDVDRFDSDEWRDKLERLADAGAVVEKDDEVEESEYKSTFDIPLTGGPGEANTELVKPDEGDSSDPAETGDENETPRPSNNASTEVWRDYVATRDDVDVPLDANRSAIIEAVDAANEAKLAKG